MVLFADQASAQCAMCKAIVESSSDSYASNEIGGGKGLNTGILYLMGVPYVLLFLLFRTRLIGFFREFGEMYKA